MKQITKNKIKINQWLLLYNSSPPEYMINIIHVNEIGNAGRFFGKINSDVFYSGRIQADYSSNYDVNIILNENSTQFKKEFKNNLFLYDFYEIFELSDEEKDMVIANSLFEEELNEELNKFQPNNSSASNYNPNRIIGQLIGRINSLTEEE